MFVISDFYEQCSGYYPHTAMSETNFTQVHWEPQQILHSQRDDFL